MLLVVGAGPDAIEVSPIQLIRGKKRIQGWYARMMSGQARFRVVLTM